METELRNQAVLALPLRVSLVGTVVALAHYRQTKWLSTESRMTDFDSAEPSLANQAADAVRTSTKAMGEVLEAAKQPDMPLDTLARITREAPMAALITAFLFGYMFARRR